MTVTSLTVPSGLTSACTWVVPVRQMRRATSGYSGGTLCSSTRVPSTDAFDAIVWADPTPALASARLFELKCISERSSASELFQNECSHSKTMEPRSLAQGAVLKACSHTTTS